MDSIMMRASSFRMRNRRHQPVLAWKAELCELISFACFIKSVLVRVRPCSTWLRTQLHKICSSSGVREVREANANCEFVVRFVVSGMKLAYLEPADMSEMGYEVVDFTIGLVCKDGVLPS